MISLPFHVRLANIVYDGWCEQERNGIVFDIEAAKKLVPQIDQWMQEIEEEVEPQLPEVELNKGELAKVTPPKRQFKKDGTPSSYSEKFFDTVIRKRDLKWYGTKEGVERVLPWHKPMYTHGPMRLKHQQALKQWLMDEYRWEPTFWNIKKEKDENGKLRPVRIKGEVVKTTPKFHNAGVLCPNLEVLGEDVAIVKHVVRWLSLRNRRSVILNEDKGTGWLCHPRLEEDGRLPARMSGQTNTHRSKHTVVANIPRVSSALGKEMRGLFVAAPGKVLVGYDASSLEARVKGHYTAKYDGGAYAAKVMADDYDEHTENALLWFDDADRRPDAKTPGYALQYFCGLATFCKALNVSEHEGAPLYEAYWEENWALKEFDEAVAQYWTDHGEKYVKLIDGSKVYTRTRHSITNAVMQGTGAKIMDLSYVFMRKWIKKRGLQDVAKRVVYYHDEYIWETLPEYGELIGKLGVKSIIKAGEYFKFRVPLDGEYKVGPSWAEIH